MILPRFKPDEWKIIESRFDPEFARDSESLFALGNGMMGTRANFEEKYSGDSLRGTYIAGVYYPDRTVVGWWKNGYPEYFAKVPNAPSWIGVDVEIDGEMLDLAVCKVVRFERTLDMKEGTLTRSFTVIMSNGRNIDVVVQRFLSISNPETAAIRYSVTVSRGNGLIKLLPYIDADVRNEDSNYGEKFWENETVNTNGLCAVVTARTRKTEFVVASAMENSFYVDGKMVTGNTCIDTGKYSATASFTHQYSDGQTIEVRKYIAVLSSMNHPADPIAVKAISTVREAAARGYERMLHDHTDAWKKIWDHGDIVIRGDIEAQQGIRFNIFHLNQTYTGDDARLNIGPKGFTGEKYGGSTYWDTEAFAFPFYLSTRDSHVARNLLHYRHNQLGKAIENAHKLGFTGGAALYPMVTMNGEECHNEWEITFEEIHRNGAIAFAIFNYTRHTGDTEYLAKYGIEVLVAISRFWAQRCNWSDDKKKYVILGVTGPNEYENNVNNNWYTNKIASWTLRYTMESLSWLKSFSKKDYEKLKKSTGLNEESETALWQKITDNIWLPESKEMGVFLQQDGFLDKELKVVRDIDPAERPLNQNWSWDRILRSVFIKQADVIQGIYLFEDEFDEETIRRNFDFYEPRCVHESSLSPSIHSVIAARLNDIESAYKLYLRTARLDLDDYNKEVSEGLHITSMAGTWLSIVEGFGGMRINDGKLRLNPVIPPSWESYSFIVRFRNNPMKVEVNGKYVSVANLSSKSIKVTLYGRETEIEPGKTQNFDK